MSNAPLRWPPVMTLQSFANLMEFPSTDAARKFIKRHEVPCCPIGNRLFVRTDSLLDFLARRENSGETLGASDTHPALRRPTRVVNAATRGEALRAAARRHELRSKAPTNVAEVPK